MKKFICFFIICFAQHSGGFGQIVKHWVSQVNTSEVNAGNQQKKKVPVKVVYTCPMHQEVLKDKPGKCPKCGMTLVKKDTIKKTVRKMKVLAELVYICPMHPEVIKDKPGKCPKCGMNLEKKEVVKKVVSKKVVPKKM